MKLSIFLILFSIFIFGQNTESELIKKYQNLDSINTYSKEFPTKLIEGSGIIKNFKNQKIGNIGFSVEITKNSSGKLIRIKKEQANHYDKKRKQIPETKYGEITIYFDENEIPEFSKYRSEKYISDKLIQQKINYYVLKNNNNKRNISELTEIKNLLSEYNTEK